MEGFDIGKRSSLRDGHLSIYTTRRHTRWGLARLAVRALFGRLSQDADFAAMAATRLRIDSRHRRVLVATDGEVNAMETPLEFRVLPRALHVIVPAA
jgi:diacylglycerol kinase family enzyme